MLCAGSYAVGTVCVAKATPIHGPKIAALLQIVGYTVLLVVTRFGMADIRRATVVSLSFGLVACAMFVVGSYLYFMGVEVAPEKTVLIEALATTGMILAGLVIHFTIGKMNAYEWAGIVGVVISVMLIQYGATLR
jgi:hypothetical protein